MTTRELRRARPFPLSLSCRPSGALGRALGSLALVFALVVGVLPQMVEAASVRAITSTTSTRCPWLVQNVAHRFSAIEMARRVARLMTPSELANFVVLHVSRGVENINVGVPRLCIPALTLVDGPGGVGNNARGVTQFPSELAVAASFNPALAHQVGFAMAQEAAAKGYDVLQAPDLNLVRTPLSGRAFETYGEDPFLASVMGVAAIEGIQSVGVMAQAKHLGAYTQENARARLNQKVAPRVLSEIYNAPFYAAVRVAHVASIMCAMGMVNGVNTCSSPWLYGSLRSWGFHGFVRSDFKAVLRPGPAFTAGMSLVKPAGATQILTALAAHRLRVRSLRAAVSAVLSEMFSYGLVNDPKAIALSAPASSASHVLVALRAERQGIVLLKNSRQVLPLSARSSVAVIGVDARQGIITRGGGSSGVHASFLHTPVAALSRLLRHARVTFTAGGPGGLEFTALKRTDVLAGMAPPSEIPLSAHNVPDALDVKVAMAPSVTSATLTATVPGRGPGWNSWDVTFRAEKTGTYVLGLEDEGDTWLSLNAHVILADRGLHGPYPQSTAVHLVGGQSYSLLAQWFTLAAAATPRLGVEYVQPQIDTAVRAARRAHTAVVFASNTLSEGADAPSLYLQGDLNALISAVAAANPRTVVVLTTGGPVLMPWRSKVAAILEAWYGGQMVGPAIAQVLAGVVDPAGRLPVSIPATPAQTPAATVSEFPGRNGTVTFGGLSDLGYRWYQSHGVAPAYPFGYGLSYTTFSWSDVSIRRSGSRVRVSVRITNTGKRSGVDIAQVYVAYPPSLDEAPEQLRGIGRVDLSPGASKVISVALAPSAFAWNQRGRFVVTPGDYTVSVGPDSSHMVASTSLHLG